MPHMPDPPYPGDDIISNATMVFDETRVIRASPAEIYPWLLQLGKNRGGWYLPFAWEHWLPASWRAARRIKPELLQFSVGDRHPDYGFSEEDYLEVAEMQQDRAIVFRSERYGVPFTWALLFHEHPQAADAEPQTTVHLRFRGKIAAVGWRKALILRFGGFMDHISTAPMLAGLADRVEKAHAS